MKRSEDNKKQGKKNRYKGAVIGLSISTILLGASTTGLAVAYGVSMSQANDYATQLENVYKKNYYELVENANSVDTNISKLLSSDEETYQAKMLSEISQDAKEMQNNIASLPLYSNSIVESVRFINQMSGYTQILDEKVRSGESLTDEDLQVLEQMHQSLTEMKVFLNKMASRMTNGYSILHSREKYHSDVDDFNLDFGGIYSEDSDYPTMIYDGPFSDSVLNKEVKGLVGDELSREEVYAKVDEIFTNAISLQYDGQTNGKFKTFNFLVTNADGQDLFVQATKIGGHILNVNGHNNSSAANISYDQAERVALDFAAKNGVEDAQVVWHQQLDDQIYFNIAPVQDGVVLYPDLVKVKVDLQYGNVVGYDAIAYFTNHTERSISEAAISESEAKSAIEQDYDISDGRLCLSPLDYNREVLCWEFVCDNDGETFYIYINAETGVEENILKVVQTSDGSKLM
jgi:germination protein YpeB